MNLPFLPLLVLFLGLPLRLAHPADPSKPDKPEAAGILLDDSDGKYTGTWVESTKQASYVGPGYRHDNHQQPGTKSACFSPKLSEAGNYEVRLLYPATNNRATNAHVIIEHAGGTKVLLINEREDCMENGVPRSLGRYPFEAGKPFSATLSNTD